MPDNKSGAPAVVTQQGAQHGESQITCAPSIAQTAGGSQAPSGKKSKKAERHVLGVKSTTYTLAVKCYDEQLPYGWPGTIAKIQALDPKKYHVLAIRHDRDEVTDGIWQTAKVKPHVHIILRHVDRKGRTKVGTLLDKLGVYFRPGTDDKLWEDHGIETVGNFAGYAVYLTHETEEAIRDAKELYDVSDIISNLTLDEIKAVREGYVRVSAVTRRVGPAEFEALDREAYDLGRAMGDFSEWYGDLPFNIRSSGNKVKTIRESYERGVTDRIAEGREIVRASIFIEGPPGCGKTASARSALLGLRVLEIGDSAHTGKFDRLRSDHDALILNDTTCSSPLDMSDNYICRAYKRGSNNPAWAGKYFIVTSNEPFRKWAKLCGIKVEDRFGNPSTGYSALRSRFYICHIAQNHKGQDCLVVDSESTRGSPKTQAARLELFLQFGKRFNAGLAAFAEMKRMGCKRGVMSDVLAEFRPWTIVEDEMMDKYARGEYQEYTPPMPEETAPEPTPPVKLSAAGIPYDVSKDPERQY